MSRRQYLHMAATVGVALCGLGCVLSVLCWFAAIWQRNDDTAFRLFMSGLLGLMVSVLGLPVGLGVYDDTRGPR